MFASFSRSWSYCKLSLAVLRDNKRFLIFPIFSGTAAILVAISFVLPLWQTGTLELWLSEETAGAAENDWGMYVTLFLFYFANYFVVLFFNCALVFAVVSQLEGERISIGQALGKAGSVIHQIFGWAFVAAIVGVILNALERNRKVGALVSAVLGSAWTALTYFVIPVIVVERASPVHAFKRSVSILKENWGTALIGNFSLGLLSFLIFLPALLLAGGFVYLGVNAGTTVGMGLNLLVAGALIVVAIAAQTALGHIFRAVLYRYSTGQPIPDSYRNENLGDAFASRASV